MEVVVPLAARSAKYSAHSHWQTGPSDRVKLPGFVGTPIGMETDTRASGLDEIVAHESPDHVVGRPDAGTELRFSEIDRISQWTHHTDPQNRTDVGDETNSLSVMQTDHYQPFQFVATRAEVELETHSSKFGSTDDCGPPEFARN